MGLNYNGDYNYARSRLENSLVLYEGKPVVVCSVELNGKTKVYYTSSVDNYNETIDDYCFYVQVEELNLEPVKLGFLNFSTHCYYYYRMPVRKYKQGLSSSSICTKMGKGGVLNSKSLFNTIVGKYPKIDNCIDTLVNEEKVSVAFSRPFSFFNKGGQIKILYKNIGEIGSFDMKNGIPNLLDKKVYLKEALEECWND